GDFWSVACAELPGAKASVTSSFLGRTGSTTGLLAEKTPVTTSFFGSGLGTIRSGVLAISAALGISTTRGASGGGAMSLGGASILGRFSLARTLSGGTTILGAADISIRGAYKGVTRDSRGSMRGAGIHWTMATTKTTITP